MRKKSREKVATYQFVRKKNPGNKTTHRRDPISPFEKGGGGGRVKGHFIKKKERIAPSANSPREQKPQ